MLIKFNENGKSVEIVRSPVIGEQYEGYLQYEGEYSVRYKLVDGNIIPMSAEDTQQELAELAAAEALARVKYTGVPYSLNGIEYAIPLTVDAQQTVTAITVAVMAQAIENTVVEFGNGTRMPILATEWMSFAEWFAGERNKLFVGA